MIVKFGENKTIGWLTKSLLDKNLKRFFDCKVNFIAANEIEHFKIVETAINKRKCLKQLSITFNKYDLWAKPNIGEIAIWSIYIKFYDWSKKKFYGNRWIDMHLLLDTLVKFWYINTTISTKKSFLFRALRW